MTVESLLSAEFWVILDPVLLLFTRYDYSMLVAELCPNSETSFVIRVYCSDHIPAVLDAPAAEGE